MRSLPAIIRKEFRQIRRDKMILRLLLIMPIIQLLVLPLAANYDIRDFKVALFDRDHSQASQRFADKIMAGGYFTIVEYASSFEQAQQLMDGSGADLIIEIPRHFDSELVRGLSPQVAVHISAVNGLKAGVAASYIGSITEGFVQEMIRDKIISTNAASQPTIAVATHSWYNPQFNYRIVLVPGILVLIITIIGIMLSSLNVVREKVSGTIEQLAVTPLSKWNFIVGKMVPFLILGILQFTVGLILAYYIYQIPINGSLPLLYLFVTIYMIGMLGLGFWVAMVSDNQLQTIFLVFFCMIIMMLMSGLFTPLESMPQWAQQINVYNPIAHMMNVVKMILVKGSSFSDLTFHMICIALFGIVVNAMAILFYRKHSS